MDVRVLTVFGGDPARDREPGASNLRAGFGSTGEAARARRREDDAACASLGVQPVRLAFDDDEASVREPAALRAALRPALRDAQVVLVPGSPLQHADHLLVAGVTEACVPAGAVLARYLEQPYATWQALSRPAGRGRAPAPETGRAVAVAGWSRSSACWRCQRRKLVAVGHYRSQLAVLRRLPRLRVAAHELLSRGERIAWPTSGPAAGGPGPTAASSGSAAPRPPYRPPPGGRQSPGPRTTSAQSWRCTAEGSGSWSSTA